MFWFGARPHPAIGIVPFKASKKRSAAARSGPASSPHSSYSQLPGGKHAADIQDHDELRIALSHALDEIGSNPIHSGVRGFWFRLRVLHLDWLPFCRNLVARIFGGEACLMPLRRAFSLDLHGLGNHALRI